MNSNIFVKIKSNTVFSDDQKYITYTHYVLV